MADLRERRIDARPATPEVAEYRELLGEAGQPPPADPELLAGGLLRLCRFRNRPALLRNNLRFGRPLSLLRASDLDGDGINEMLVVDSDRTIHALRLQPGMRSADTPLRGSQLGRPGWQVSTFRYRGRMLGLTFSGFGVLRRQEAILTSVEEHSEGSVYYELKLTCDGSQWEVTELQHRRPASVGAGGALRLIGESREPGRVPVLRVQDDRQWAEVLDDRDSRQGSAAAPGVGDLGLGPGAGVLSGSVPLPPGEVAALSLCDRELVVAYRRGGLLCFGPSGLLAPPLFPELRITCLTYASARQLGRDSGLLLCGTSTGHVVAVDTRQGGVRWRMDAGFLFSCMALADVGGSGRTDLLIGGIDGGLRVYELLDGVLVEGRCCAYYQALGRGAAAQKGRAADLLGRHVPPGQEGYAPLQLFLLSRILEDPLPAPQAVLELARWFTSGQSGWHMLPERAQREAVVLLERFLLQHLPLAAGGERRSTITGPLPIVTRESAADPQVSALLTETILAELADVYLAAPRLVRRQIDRISRRLAEQYWHRWPHEVPAAAAGRVAPLPSADGAAPPPQLLRLLNARGLRAREYAAGLMLEAEDALRRPAAVSQEVYRQGGGESNVLLQVLRGIGFIEEARQDRFSMEFERLDLTQAVFEPGGLLRGQSRSWVAGIGRNGTLRIETVPACPSQDRREAQLVHELALGGAPAFVAARRLLYSTADSGAGGGRAGVVVGLGAGGGEDGPRRTRLRLYAVASDGQASFLHELEAPGELEPVGFEVLPAGAGEGAAGDADGPREVLLLHAAAASGRERAALFACDAPDGRLRLQPFSFPEELLHGTGNRAAVLQLSPSRLYWRSLGRKTPISVTAPAEGRCGALSDGGELLAVGTASGLVQIFAARGGALRLLSQYLLHKGISALCFVPAPVFGVPALAVGTEEEQVHIFAADEPHEGQELARLMVGGAPLSMTCAPIVQAGGPGAGPAAGANAVAVYRLAMTLHGGVVAAWDAPRESGDEAMLARLLDLATRAAGGRRAALAAALRGPGPHVRAVAMREILRDARAAGRAAVLRLALALLGEPAPAAPGTGEPATEWPLPRPERHHLVLLPLIESLVPIALGAGSEPLDLHDTRLARELLQRVLQSSDAPLAIREDLLHAIEAQAGPEHVPFLLDWLPQLVLLDPRSATWPFSIDSVGLLFLQHLKRMARARRYEDAEPQFFRNVATVLEAVLPSQPSRLMLTAVALLLRSALPWERATWAGDLARARLYLPHAVIEALCVPAIIADPDARLFLLGVSRRWGPRFPMLGNDEGADTPGGVSGIAAVDEYNLDSQLLFAVENGFDDVYYEKLADELARFTRSALPGQEPADAWDLADTVQAVLKLFKVANLTELEASLKPIFAERSLQAIRSHRSSSQAQEKGGRGLRYRDQAWAFLDEQAYEDERLDLSLSLAQLDRKSSKARLTRSIHEVALRLEERRVRLLSHVLERISGALSAQRLLLTDELPGALPAGGYAELLLKVRPTATVVALMGVWWDVLNKEQERLRSEADFEVRLTSDLGVSEGRRMLRYGVALATDTTRTAHGVLLTVRACSPAELRARPTETEPVDLEPGKELSLVLDCPMQMAADGLRYRVEIELSHDDDKRTERVIEGQFSRDPRPQARGFFDSLAEAVPTLFATRAKQLGELLEPAHAAVALVTAFPAHAYELLGEAVGLEWPDRPIDTFGNWRMVNLAARHVPPSGALPALGPAGTATAPPLRDILQQVGARLGSALGLDGPERLDTVDAIVRAVAEAPAPGGTAPRGLLILGLAELCDKARLEDGDARQLLSLGPRLCLAWRGRALVLLSPQAAALSLEQAALHGGGSGPAPALELLDLDHVADPLSSGRSEDRARGELEQVLAHMLGDKGDAEALHAAVHALIDGTGTDLRLIAECLPLVEQALRERTRTPPGISAFEGRVGNYLAAVWAALPQPHRLYLAALASDAVELDVGELRPGMVVDAAVHSISGKDRQQTSKVVVAANVCLDQREVEGLEKVKWLKKVRVRGSLSDSKTVLWTYLRQPRPHYVELPEGAPHGSRAGGRWLELATYDLKRLGLVQRAKLSGERTFHAFTSPAVREWLRNLLGLPEGEGGLLGTIDGRNLVRQLPLWDAVAVDRTLGGNSAQLKAVLRWSRAATGPTLARWQEFLELSRACRKWIDGYDEPRFIEALTRYYRLDPVEGTGHDMREPEKAPGHGPGPVLMRSVQVRFRDQRQLPWLKRVILYLPSQQPDRATLDLVQQDLRGRMQAQLPGGSSGPHFVSRPDAAYAGAEGGVTDTALSAIVVVPELSAEVIQWSRHLFHVAAIDATDLQYAALHDNPVEELIRRLAAAASYAALSPFRSKMGLANQELIEEMFYGRRLLLEEIRGQRQENFIVVGPRKIGKTSLLQRVRFELEQQGYRVIPKGMDYTTAPTSQELLRGMISDLLEDLEPARGPSATLHAAAGQGGQHFALGEGLPPLQKVVDAWAQRHPDRSLAIVLDEIDTVLRIERRAYLLGEWREAWTIGEALGSLLPPQGARPTEEALRALRGALTRLSFTRDVIEGVVEGLRVEPTHRKQSPLLEELRSASALLLRGGAVCRVILAGHAELAEARGDLFGPLLNFAKLRYLGPLDDASAERMVREPFARLGLRFENAAAEQLLLSQTFRVPAWIQHCGALIIQGIDERLRSSRRDEQKITELDVSRALDKVHAEERAALQSESGLYMLGPECSFVLLTLVDEPWFTIDGAVEFLRVWFELLEPQQRAEIAGREKDFQDAFSREVIGRIVRDLTNTFYLSSDDAAGQGQGMLTPSGMTPAYPAPMGRDRLRRTYRVNAPMVRTVFRDELTLAKRIDLARRGLHLWKEDRGVWARTSSKI